MIKLKEKDLEEQQRQLDQQLSLLYLNEDENDEEELIEEKKERKTLDPLVSLKLKASFLFSKSLAIFFKSLRDFLSFVFIYVIFAVNTYFFYSFARENLLSLFSCIIFFVMSMGFYILVKRLEK